MDQQFNFAARHAEGGGDVGHVFPAAQQAQCLDALLDIQAGTERQHERFRNGCRRSGTVRFLSPSHNLIDADPIFERLLV